MELTEEQAVIINLIEGQHLVLAPPGTGKTELLARRVENALENGFSQEKMICLTFTNRAAKVMKDRIEAKHPKIEVFIGNIHHYCSTFLFYNNFLPKYTSLIDEHDSYLLIQEAKELSNFFGELYTPEVLKLNTYLKQRNLGFPEAILLAPSGNVLNDLRLHTVCKKYEELKEESSLLDFDDLLTLTYLYLTTRYDESSLKDFSWIQVDEVQDINPIQCALIDLISVQDNCHRVFFGDYEQAIFSFMGARLENLHKIEGSCKIYNLQKNFRSPSYLLNIYIDFAKKYLAPKWKKDPIPNTTVEAGKDDLILCSVRGTVRDEAYAIASKLLTLYNSQEEKGQTAILVRTNDTADIFGQVLNQFGIEHFKISGFDLFRRKVIKDLISFFDCLTNELSRVSWFRLYSLFSPLKSLKEARHFVNELFSVGLMPSDFLQNTYSSYLQDYSSSLTTSRLVVFDTETTGLIVEDDDIIQLAAIEVINGEKMRTFNVYLNTNRSLNDSQKVHGITVEFLSQHGINRKEALLSFLSFLENSTMVAHNISFDYEILRNNLVREGISTDLTSVKQFDTLELTRRLFPMFHSYKLEKIINYLNIEGKNTHNAIDDVEATVNLLSVLNQKSMEVIPKQNDFIRKHQDKISILQEKLGPYWRSINDKKDEITSFGWIIDDFYQNAASLINYNLEESDLIHILKLKRHMVSSCGEKKLRGLLQDHISEYLRYKESDLLIGDEPVVISTVHKAKGLEFKNVIIAECVDSVYPNYYSNTQEQKTEDARLLYVAISRSKCCLALTYHTTFVSKNGNSFPRTPSPFLGCIAHHFKSYNM